MNTHKEPNWCKTSQQWVEELYPAGNPVVDPDGWDRKDFEYSWHQEPISRDEFEKRLMNSTLRMPPVLVEPTPPSQIEEEPTEARLLKLEQEMAELYPRVEDLVRKVFNNTK